MECLLYHKNMLAKFLESRFPLVPWWRHQVETYSALLALCAGNSPITGEFPSQRPVTRSFDVFFHLRLNKRLCKQSRSWWFETPSHSLWRLSNVKPSLHDLPQFDYWWFLLWAGKSISVDILDDTIVRIYCPKYASFVEYEILRFQSHSNPYQVLFWGLRERLRARRSRSTEVE